MCWESLLSNQQLSDVLLDFVDIWYTGALWVCRGAEWLNIHLQSSATNSASRVGQKIFSENPEKICDKLIFSLVHNTDQVVYHVKNPHCDLL